MVDTANQDYLKFDSDKDIKKLIREGKWFKRCIILNN